MSKRRDKDLDNIISLFLLFFVFSIWHVWTNYRTQFYLVISLIIILIVGIIFVIHRIKKRRFDDFHKGMNLLSRLKKMDPDEFEEYIADLYRRLGYKTEKVGKSHDGGIDVIAIKDGVKHYIQCKKYITSKAGSGDLRDFGGALMDKLAEGKGIFITTNVFTTEAEMYAKDKPIELIDGNRLLKLIKKVGKESESLEIKDSSRCPECDGNLIERTSKYGKFIGCSNYPKCKYIKK